MLYFMLLLVVSTAKMSCGAGQDDTAAPDSACAACGAGKFKATAGATDCAAYANTTANCTDKKRTLTDGTSKTEDDSSCSATCATGFAVAEGGDAATGDCSANCAPGFGGAACAACTGATHSTGGPVAAGATQATCKANTVCATEKTAAKTDRTADAICEPCATGKHTTDNGATCVDNKVCADKYKTAPFKIIAATATTNTVCGCEAGKSTATCTEACEAKKWLAAGDNEGKSKADCATCTECKGTATAKEANSGVDQWGYKSECTAGADAVCNLAKPDAPAVTSSAAVLAIPAFLIALLF